MLIQMRLGRGQMFNTDLHICKRHLRRSKDEKARLSKVDGRVYSKGLCRVLIRNIKITLMLSLSLSQQEYLAASWPNVEVQILKIESTFRANS